MMDMEEAMSVDDSTGPMSLGSRGPRFLRLVAAVVALQALSAVAVYAAPPSPVAGCTPTLEVATRASVDVHTQTLSTWTGNYVIVGCREHLQALTLDERQWIGAIVATFVQEHDDDLLQRRKDAEFRSQLLKRITKYLGRPVVTEVWLDFTREPCP
jgi:hypothetical protein